MINGSTNRVWKQKAKLVLPLLFKEQTVTSHVLVWQHHTQNWGIVATLEPFSTRITRSVVPKLKWCFRTWQWFSFWNKTKHHVFWWDWHFKWALNSWKKSLVSHHQYAGVKSDYNHTVADKFFRQRNFWLLCETVTWPIKLMYSTTSNYEFIKPFAQFFGLCWQSSDCNRCESTCRDFDFHLLPRRHILHYIEAGMRL